MGGDYSRLTFEPRRNFSSVLMQQGRVHLDSDWNELAHVIDRRLRTMIVDLVGRSHIAHETPDAFRIDLSSGAMTIGRGRIYVDGLQAENHGAGPLEFDPVLDEQRGTTAIAYVDQPFMPDANTRAPLPKDGLSHLVYLDVWEREVTCVEDPNLVEIALGGPDSATRIQIAWQVRVCPLDTTDSPDWRDLTAPSPARLTVSATGESVMIEAASRPPGAGYFGVDNRLYRVEIHEGGLEGAATFKWSRENGSVATEVIALSESGTDLALGRVGSAADRFADGRWVEVSDDWQEFYGLSGAMRRIVKVDRVRPLLRVDHPLPPDTFDPSDPARHTRVRQWDHAPGDVSGGVITVPADGVSVELEDGVRIRFSTDPPGARLRVGEYWVFAARAVDGSVEELISAPPRAPHHHYCELAIISLSDDGVDDRRGKASRPGRRV